MSCVAPNSLTFVPRGVIPRTFDHIFDHVASSDSVKFLLTASYLEIYNEEVRDLLGRDVRKRLELHEHPERGVYVQGLSHHKVRGREGGRRSGCLYIPLISGVG